MTLDKDVTSLGLHSFVCKIEKVIVTTNRASVAIHELS